LSFYGDLRNVATGLLREFKQGTVEAGRAVSVPGATAWAAPTITVQWTPINAVARGVSQKYVDGANIIATDRQVTIEAGVWSFQAGDRLRIDNKEVVVLRVDPIPAAGAPVAWRVFVRG
jgi:hypothetical protein